MAAASKERSQKSLTALFNALTGSVLLVPVRTKNDEPVENDAGVEIAAHRDKTGVTYFGYTDLRELGAATGPSGPYVAMEAPVLARTVLEDPEGTLVINSASADAGRLSRRDLEVLADRIVPQEGGRSVGSRDGTLRIFPLTSAPSPTFVSALADVGRALPAIRSIDLFEGALGEGTRHLFVGVAIDPSASDEDVRATMGKVAEALSRLLPRNERADVIRLQGSIAERAAAVCTPVFRSD